MASANLRATGAAPRVVARSSASSRVATMFRTAGPDAERKLGDAMVAAAGKFGAKHQMEVRAALSEDAPAPERRAFLKKALLGVRARADPRAITRRDPTSSRKKQPTRGGICLSTRVARVFPFSRATESDRRCPPRPPVSPIVQQAAAVMPAAAANAADDQGVASSRMSYSRFLVRPRPVDDRQSRHAGSFLNRRGAIEDARSVLSQRIEVYFRAFFLSRSRRSETPQTRTRL